jgi:hypothetical protein
MLRHVFAVVRACEPCLSRSTHAFGVPALVDACGTILDERSTD